MLLEPVASSSLPAGSDCQRASLPDSDALFSVDISQARAEAALNVTYAFVPSSSGTFTETDGLSIKVLGAFGGTRTLSSSRLRSTCLGPWSST
jgi:hypothetical protein